MQRDILKRQMLNTISNSVLCGFCPLREFCKVPSPDVDFNDECKKTWDIAMAVAYGDVTMPVEWRG